MQVIQQGNQLATNMLDVHEIMLPAGSRGLNQLFLEKPVVEAYEPKSWEIITPEDVTFYKNSTNDTCVAINDEWEVKLDRRHNAVGQLALGIDPELLKATFLEGRYFLVDDQIVDFRTGDHIGFEHTADGLMNLIKAVGMTVDRRGKIHARSVTGRFEYDATNTEGGAFDIQQGFLWSPFSLDISAHLEMLRLACYNGLVVSDPVMNHKIPVMNGWEENLAIANDVIRHAFDHKVGPRLSAMPSEMISMHDAMGLCDLIGDALEKKKGDIIINHNELVHIHEKLQMVVTDEARALQKNLLKFVSVPITAFDAMNVATECATHHIRLNTSESNKLAGLANNLLFSTARQAALDVNLDNLVMDTKVFADTDKAFHGITCH